MCPVTGRRTSIPTSRCTGAGWAKRSPWPRGGQAAAECGKTLLRAIQERYGTLDCIAGLVRALILVNCGDGF